MWLSLFWLLTLAENAPLTCTLPGRSCCLVLPLLWPTNTTESSFQFTILCPRCLLSAHGDWGLALRAQLLFNKVHSIQGSKINLVSSLSFHLVLKEKWFISWRMGRDIGRSNSPLRRIGKLISGRQHSGRVQDAWEKVKVEKEVFCGWKCLFCGWGLTATRQCDKNLL